MDEWYLAHAERLVVAEVENGVARARTREVVPHDWDGRCTDCGDEVPAERHELTGSVLCVHCKAFRER